MTDEDRIEELLNCDWGDAWDALSPAPPLILSQQKSAQITLRLPSEMIVALKEVARLKALPYHALARSWIAEGLHERRMPSSAPRAPGPRAPGDTQLNIKMTPALLTEVKSLSDEIRIPYHRLARTWIEIGLRRELAALERANGHSAVV